MSGQPMSLELVRKLYSRIASINMCPCRVLEEINMGWPSTLETALSYVSKDLAYNKEHAQLQNKALAWETAVSNGAPEPLLQEAEAVFWGEWVSRAEARKQDPPPTDLMKGFIRVSNQNSARRRSRTRLLALGLIFFLVAGIIASTTAAIVSLQATAKARESAAAALAAEDLSEQRAYEAQLAKQLAEERAHQAEQARMAIVATSALPWLGTIANTTDQWELTVAAAAMTTIYGSGLRSEFEATVSMARALSQADLVRLLLEAGSIVQHIAWSPSCSQLAVAAQNRLLLWDRAAQPPVTPAPEGWSSVHALTVQSRAGETSDTGISWEPALAWSTDGRHLAAGFLQTLGSDSSPSSCSVALWWDIAVQAVSVPTNNSPLVVPVSSEERCQVQDVAWSGDNAFLAAAFRVGWESVGTVLVWSISPSRNVTRHLWLEDHFEEFVSTLVGTMQLNTVAITPESSRQVMVWSPNSALLTSPGKNGTVRVINAAMGSNRNGTAASVLTLGHNGTVTNLAWQPARPYPQPLRLASSSTDGSVVMWEWATGTSNVGSASAPVATVLVNAAPMQLTSATAVAWAPSAPFLAAGFEDGFVRIWRMNNRSTSDGGRAIEEVPMAQEVSPGNSAVLDIAWELSSSARLAVGRHDGYVSVYSLSSPRVLELESLHNAHLHTQPRTLRPPMTLSWANDGSHFLAINPVFTSEVHVWELPKSNSRLPGWKGMVTGLQPAEGYEVAWTPDGSLVAVSSVLEMVDVQDSRVDLLLPAPFHATPRGEDALLAGGLSSFENPLVKLSQRDGAAASLSEWCLAVQRSLAGGAGSLLRFHFLSSLSPDCSHLADVTSFGEARLLNLLAPSTEATYLGQWTVAAWSMDGQLALGFQDTVHIWDRSAFFGSAEELGPPALTLAGNFTSFSWIHEMAFSPDNSKIAAGTGAVMMLGGQVYRGELCVWQLSTGELFFPELCREESLSNPVSTIEWSPGSSSLAVGLEESGEILVMTLNTESPKQTWLPGRAKSVTATAWRSDETRLASGYADGTVRLWELDSKTFQALEAHTEAVWSIAWSPNRSMIATGGTDGVRLWEHLEEEEFLHWFEGRYTSTGFRLSGSDLAHAGIPAQFRSLLLA